MTKTVGMPPETCENLLGSAPSKTRTGSLRDFGRFVSTLVMVSRPGMWHFTGFLYVLPAASDPASLLTLHAALGLLFAVLPVNLLVYSMNDLRDVDIDATNPRKGGIHGAQASGSDLWVCVCLSVVLTSVLPPLLIADGFWCATWSCFVIGVNWLYNFGPQLSRVPVLDMICPLGYLLIIPFSAKNLGLTSRMGPYFLMYMSLGVFRTQLWFQRFDMEADASVGKQTTALFLGKRCSAAMLVLILACEFLSASLWGCEAAQLWSAYCFGVFVLELLIARRSVTTALMAISSAFIVLFYPCLAAAWEPN